MRLLGEMIDRLSATVRVIAGLFAFCAMAFGAMVTFGMGWAAPQVADRFAERAQTVREKAIEARAEAERARALAKEGWGYEVGTGPSRVPPAAPRDRSRPGEDGLGGWGEES